MISNKQKGEGIIFCSLKSLLKLQSKAALLTLAKRHIRSHQTGQHLSIFKGRGMDFAESRPYQAGDDIRTLDWRVTARTGKPHTKVFQEERERPILICLDMRPNVFFATQGCFKSVIIAEVAALLAWYNWTKGDRIGGMLIADDQHIEIKPARSKNSILHFMQKISTFSQHFNQENKKNHSFNQGLKRLRRVINPGSQVYILSDCRDIQQTGQHELIAMRQHAEVTLVKISDPIENHLPEQGTVSLTDGKQSFWANLGNKKWRNQYFEQQKNRQEKLKSFVQRHRIHLIELSTADSFKQRLQKLAKKL